MSVKDPLLYPKRPEELMQSIADALQRTGWRRQKESAGEAMVQLFGRLAQVISHRLNQVPRQHFRTFLNAAGIERLPPRAATTELTFTPAPDGPPAILAPVGTQVATRPTETQSEIIFETEQALVATPTMLDRCFVVDPVNLSDCTAIANGQQAGAFAAFAGETERTRTLYIGHDTLLLFADEASRLHATVTLTFTITNSGAVATFANSGAAAREQWQVQWLYWDGEQWANLSKVAGVVIEDQTANFCQDGAVHFRHLPSLLPSPVNDVTSVWLAARLTGGNSRDQLPIVHQVNISRTITIPGQQAMPAKIDRALATVQAGSTFFPLDAQGPALLPLGPHPMPLDAFYLQVNEAFTKTGALVTITLTLDELSDKLAQLAPADQPRIAWEYCSTAGWTLLGESWLGSPALAKRNYDDPKAALPSPTVQTQPFTRSKYLEFKLSENGAPPVLPEALEGATLVTDIYTGATYAQLPIPDAWTKSPDYDLIHGAYSAEPAGEPTFHFRDKTCALTTAGIVQFVVPNGRKPETPCFAETTINGQTGYWVRARLVAGAYAVPQPPPSLWQGLVAKAWLPSQSYPPVIQGIAITYRAYAETSSPEAISRCQSQVDKRWRDHAADLRDGRAFQPFTGPIEEAALYLGFLALANRADRSLLKPAFPAGQLIQLRIAVAERTGFVSQAPPKPPPQAPTEPPPTIIWEYWNGRQWIELRTLDGTADLHRTGYLKFYTHADHAPSDEFGVRAYWLRVRRSASTLKPMPYLATVRLNTVAAINAETIRNELIRPRSDGKVERYFLARPPVLPESVQLEIFEPDQRSETTLTPAIVSGVAPAATTVAGQATGAWMAWQQVATFHGAASDGRVYLLDPSSGEISFGNGEHGRALPPGVDNVRALLYRTHRGAAGNVAANTIRVLRNATGDVATIQQVTNWEAAAGGTDVETEAAVEERGPQRLKNRQRAVTLEDFAWLAREVEGVAHAYCLPTRDPQGQIKPGWVTVIILPKPAYTLPDQGERPAPTPALLQQVRAYLEKRLLVNLKGAVGSSGQANSQTTVSGIVVKGPAYLVVAVNATVVLHDPTQINEVRPAIRARLDAFLHPTQGGPERKGWEPGRDVYPSEVAAEIEQTPGVDYVKTISLQGASLQQQRLTVDGEPLPWAMPAGSQVSTVDEQCKMALAAPLAKGAAPTQLLVYGLKEGDTVNVVTAAPGPTPFRCTVAQLANRGFTLFFNQPFEFADAQQYADWQRTAPMLTANDRTLALPMQPYFLCRDTMGKLTLYGALILYPAPGLDADDTAQQVAIRLNAGGGVNIALTGQPGPEPAKPRLVRLGAEGLPVIFDEPLIFPDGDKFAHWREALPALTADDQTIRLPIAIGEPPTPTSEILLQSVIGRAFQIDEQLYITQRDHRFHWAPLGSVRAVPVDTAVEQLFVPDDTLVCAGNHLITLDTEAKHGNSATPIR